MSEVESFGWGCYWKLKSNQEQVAELIKIIQDLGGEKELQDWLLLQKKKEEEREERKLKRELNKFKKYKK